MKVIISYLFLLYLSRVEAQVIGWDSRAEIPGANCTNEQKIELGANYTACITAGFADILEELNKDLTVPLEETRFCQAYEDMVNEDIFFFKNSVLNKKAAFSVLKKCYSVTFFID